MSKITVRPCFEIQSALLPEQLDAIKHLDGVMAIFKLTSELYIAMVSRPVPQLENLYYKILQIVAEPAHEPIWEEANLELRQQINKRQKKARMPRPKGE